MIDTGYFFISLFVMAGVTYLVRMLPLVLVKRKIENRFIRSFLYYMPYAVLGAMTIPAIFYSTSYLVSAIAGFMVAIILAYLEKRLIVVAACSCAAVLIVELLAKYVLKI